MEHIEKNWNLENFYKGLEDKKLEEDIEKIKRKAQEIEDKYKGKLKNFSEKEFLEYFKDDEELDYLISNVEIYLLLRSSLETQNQEIIKKQDEIDNILTEISNQLLFIQEEFKEIGSEKLFQLAESEELSEYKNFFVQTANNIKYKLDEKVEHALNIKERSGAGMFVDLYEELTGSFTFPFTEKDGTRKEYTDAEIRALRSSPDEEVRKKAFESIREVYGNEKYKIVIGNIYKAILKDWNSEMKLRGFSDVAEKRNIQEELSNDIVDTLLEEVENAYQLYHRFLQCKAKILGKDKLKLWDVYAPVKNEEKKYEFKEALDIYLSTIKSFDQEFYHISKKILENGRVDVFPVKGKRGGAFAVYDKNINSYVMLNFTGRLEDVSTLAHEMGHAIHGHLSQNLPSQVYGSPLSLAETASVFNETLLGDKLQQDLDEKDKLSFLQEKLDEIFATIFRQVQYVLFEKKVHEKTKQGEELSYEDFSVLWREESEKLLGGMVEFETEKEKEIGWETIPHIFHTPFYCYTYAFGNLLSLSLYQKYKEEGDDFKDKYKNILKAGGSVPPKELLEKYGIDISSPQHYRNGLKVIEEMVEEFEQLSNH